MFKKYYSLPLAAAVCLVFFMALPAMAQEDSQQQGQPGETQPDVSDADLEKVAAAYVEVIKINKEFQESVQQTQDATERQELQQEANKEMVQAVEDAGIDVQTYNVIMQQVRTDNELLKKFTKFEEKAKSS
jgi:tRNA C32,U32 (ribose-2'-O)-methylase TrmJ